MEPITRADSKDAEALALAGEAQLQLGNASAAELLFNRAAKLAPDDPRLRTSLALMKLAHGEAAAAFAAVQAAQTAVMVASMTAVSAAATSSAGR